MTAPDFQRAIDAFAHAHALRTSAELEAYLSVLGEESPELRAEIESLLAGRTSTADSTSRRTPGSAEAGGPPRTHYPTIPNCLITGEIGSGGFGTVYRARRSSSELAPVAIKVLRGDSNSEAILERFLRERQLHAQMDSSFVAHVYDVGTSAEGEPYLMMELVEGSQNFMSYAEEHKLTIKQRLALFKMICEGVEHLHRNGMYHRDLKPSNILVTEVDGIPRPKIIDFGLAKTDEEQGLTREGVRIGTPLYMSPEQEAGESLDSRTDIYSLGVLLHELLTGTRPDMVRSSEDETRLPSSRVVSGASSASLAAERRMESVRQLSKALKGDLDMIILKCIQFERRNRYQSAHELRADIIRHEEHEPVEARGKSGLYAVGRLASRYRVATFAICAGILSLVTGFSVASIALADQRLANKELLDAKQGTDAALRREERANTALIESNAELEQIVAYERERLTSIDPAAMEPFLRREILSQAQLGLQQLHGTAGQARFEQFKRTLENTNFTTVALEALEHGVFRDAEANIDAAFADHPELRARMLLELSSHLSGAGLLDLAESPVRSALELRVELFGGAAHETLLAKEALGALLRTRGHFDEAREHLSTTIAEAEAAEGALAPITLRLRLELASIALSGSDGAKALEQLEDLHSLFVRTFGRDSQETNRVTAAIANAMALSGRGGESVAKAREAHLVVKERLGAGDVETLQALYNLGLALIRNGQNDEAADVIRRAYEGLSQARGLDHSDTLNAATLLSQVLINEGSFAEASGILRSSLETSEEKFGANNVNTIRALANLSHVLRLTHDLTEAGELGAQAIERARAVLPTESQLLGGMLVDFGRTLAGDERMEEAEAAMLEGYDILERALGDSSLETCTAADALSALYQVWHGLEPDAGYGEEELAWKERTKGLTLTPPKAKVDAASRDN